LKELILDERLEIGMGKEYDDKSRPIIKVTNHG
jgi:hypothetical protein